MSAARYIVLFASVALACSAVAQGNIDPPAASASYAQSSADQGDPPARVARLAFVRGEVNFAPAGENDWVQAQLNRPVVTGDKLWTDNGGRAELQVGAATIRMNQHTSFDFLNLNDQTAQIELTQGSLDLDVRRIHGNETYEIDTPTLAFVADRVGDYRVDVDAQGKVTTVTVRRGGGELYGENGARVQIGEGQSLAFDNPQLRDYKTVRIEQAAPRDDFDTFVSERTRRYERPVAANYVSEDVVGYEDLDAYGSWNDAPEYGHVWYPNNVGADWAPYHDGRWTWVEPWGWTWVDDAPWGFAPFHYGRWVYNESRWGWVPGPVDVRPVYAPALVAFVGGGGVGLDISVGGPIGWFALGPRDVYFPGYRCGRNYFTSINVSNARIGYASVNNYYGGWSRGSVNYAQINYANRNRPGALAAMPASAFVNGHSAATSDLTMNSRAALANGRVIARATVVPTRASVLAAEGRAARGGAPAAAFNRQVVAAHAPPPAPASFAARQRLLQRTPGQPLSTTQLRTLAAQQPQRDRNVRAVSNQRAVLANTPSGMNRVPVSPRANERAQAAARGAAAIDAQANARGHVRSADYAHAGRAAQTAPGLGRREAPAANLRSSQFAQSRQGRTPDRTALQSQRQAVQNQPRFERAPTRNTERTAMQQRANVRAPQHIERAARPAPESRVVTAPQQARTPHYAVQRDVQQRQVVSQSRAPTYQRAMTQHQEQRIATASRPVERSMPPQRRVVAQPQHVPQPQRVIERPAPLQHAQARAQPQMQQRFNPPPQHAQAQAQPQMQQRFNPPPASQPPRQVAPQQVARQNVRQPAANPHKDKHDNGRD